MVIGLSQYLTVAAILHDVIEDGSAAEVGMVGREGMIGLPVLLGSDQDDIEAMVHLPGTALSMDAQAFREELMRRWHVDLFPLAEARG